MTAPTLTSDSPPEAQSSSWRAPLLATTGYLLLSLLLLVPVSCCVQTAIPGGRIAATDGWQNVWFLWWNGQALLDWQSPFFSPLLYHPDGARLALQPLGLSNALLTMPVNLLFGPIAAYNLAVLLAFVLSGLAGYLLARRVSGNQAAAFVGGLIFAFSPYHLTRLWDGQLELMATHWPAFYAFFLLRAVEERRPRDVLLAGLFLALTGYSSWYYLLFAALYSLAFAALWIVPLPAPVPQSRLPLPMVLTGTALSAGLLLAPALVAAFGELYGPQAGVEARNPQALLTNSANLLDFWLPSYLHPLWGDWIFDNVSAAWHQLSGDWNTALGYLPLALAGLALWKRRDHAWRWGVLAALALLFALGPRLQIGPWFTNIPLPYALLSELPGAGFGRRPGLFVMMATLALTPLAALGLAWLLEHSRSDRRGPIYGGLLLLLVFELLPRPLPLNRPVVHPYYAGIPATPGAVMEMPPARYKRIEPQLAQMFSHGRPIFGGYLARPQDYPISREHPALRRLWYVRPDEDSPFFAADDSLAALASLGMRHLVVYPDLLADVQRERLDATLAQALPGLAPAYQDEEIRAYELPDASARPYAYFAGGWYRAETEGERRWRWMSASGSIRIVNPHRQAVPARLMLEAESAAGSRDLHIRLNGQTLQHQAIQPAATRLNLQFLLPPGAHELQLEARAERESGGNRTLSIVLTDWQLRTP